MNLPSSSVFSCLIGFSDFAGATGSPSTKTIAPASGSPAPSLMNPRIEPSAAPCACGTREAPTIASEINTAMFPYRRITFLPLSERVLSNDLALILHPIFERRTSNFGVRSRGARALLDFGSVIMISSLLMMIYSLEWQCRSICPNSIVHEMGLSCVYAYRSSYVSLTKNGSPYSELYFHENIDFESTPILKQTPVESVGLSCLHASK